MTLRRSRTAELCVALLLVCANPGPAAARPPLATARASPAVMFGDLFVAVQEARVFADGKAFADAVPQQSTQHILQAYSREGSPTTPRELEQFVATYFALPSDSAAQLATPASESIVEHIDRLWQPLTRSTPTAPAYSSLISLPRPYVVPGGRFREMYYWDSYFTMLGLAASGRRDLVADMVDNFAYLIDTFGHIPNGTRTYYLSRSQPPFFFAMVGLLTPSDPVKSFARYLPQLRREHAFWMAGATHLARGYAYRRVVALPDGAVLNRFYDDEDTPRDESYREDAQLARETRREPRQLFRDIRAAAESGWDFSSRWFADGHSRGTLVTTEILPVDLNSLLFGLENAIASGCKRIRDTLCTHDFEHRAGARRHALERYLWDDASGTYQDYRWTQGHRIAHLSAATLYPLFVGMASSSQAALVAAATTRDLLRPGGVVTTPVNTGQQWDSPNGWAPLQWLAIDGFRRYSHAGLAQVIACRWMVGVNRVYRAAGKLVEKYDVVTTGRSGGGGEYPAQDGFGWTNGVMRQLIALYPRFQTLEGVEQCPAGGPPHATH